MRLTVVCDDFSGAEPGYRTSYGFALVIETQHRTVLFDTGTHPRDLMANLHAYGLHGRDLSAVILSHNHFDHTDGLPGLLEQNPDLRVCVHENWDEPHSFKGFSVPRRNRVVRPGGGQLAELGQDLLLTSCQFSTDYGGIYEHACWALTGSSSILITGCCHPGLDVFLNELPHHATGNERALCIVGGLHGFSFSAERARAIDPQLQRIVCCHCTAQYDTFEGQFGDRCQKLPVGATWEIP